MSRSLKKGPFVEEKLFTRIEAMNAANDKKVAMCVADGWYIYSFFKGAGFDMSLNADGTNSCNWNAAGSFSPTKCRMPSMMRCLFSGRRSSRRTRRLSSLPAALRELAAS